MLLPGVAGLLGFQVAASLLGNVHRLAETPQIAYQIGVACVTASALLLVLLIAMRHAPGSDESVRAPLRVALLTFQGAVSFLVVGLSIDLFVAADQATGSLSLGVAAGAAMFFLCRFTVL